MIRSIAAIIYVTLLLLIAVPARTHGEDWPQWRGVNRDGVWRESGVIKKFTSNKLERRWSIPVSSGYSGPTVADNRVFLTDRRIEPEQQERVLCFDAKTGRQLWEHAYACPYERIGYKAGPRACVTVEDNRAFSLGAMGNLICLDVGGGKLWEVDLNKRYSILASRRMPVWGLSCAPLVYQDLLIVQIGAKDACVVAFDKKSGEEKWRSLSDRACYSAPILVKQAGRDVVICWTGDSVAGLDPSTGDVHWRFPFAPKNMPIGIATPVVHDDRVFVTSFYDGSLMLQLMQDQLKARKVWQRVGPSEKQTDALQSIISTPVFDSEHIYGVDSYGELRCLDAKNGDRVWEDQTATPRNRWSNIHFVRNGDNYWMFNESGELIIARLSPDGFHEISRAKLIDPTRDQLARRNGVCWSHPAFANRHVFARNDKELVCASLEAE